MILQIDVTVTGPDSVMSGSTAVTVNVPAAQAADPNQQMKQRVQSQQWMGSRA